MLFDEIDPQKNGGAQGQSNLRPVRAAMRRFPDVEL